jgi:hypothetical protein
MNKTGSSPKELNKRQWYLPIIQKESKASRAYFRTAQGGLKRKETPLRVQYGLNNYHCEAIVAK